MKSGGTNVISPKKKGVSFYGDRSKGVCPLQENSNKRKDNII